MKQESKALVTGAAEKLVAFVSACERELTAEVVNGYLCDGFAELCRALNGLRTENSGQETLAVAKRMEDSLMALDGCVVRMFGRLGREPRRSFGRAALIVGSVFKPGAFLADKEIVETVYNDILNRSEEVKKPILQQIFKDKSHPCWTDTAWILDVTGELPKKK